MLTLQGSLFGAFTAPPDPPQPVVLRPYQREAVEEVDQLVAAGARRILVVAPTGSGKTTLAVRIILDATGQNRCVLFVAHRRELIDQAYRRLILMGLSERQVGVIMATDPRRRPGALVQVASIDTLRNRAKPRADLVFRDEAHRALSKTDRALQQHYPRATHIGLTATPYRADGKGLGDAYDALVVVASPRHLIDEGYLVEPRVFTVPSDQLPDLASVRTRRGDFDERELARAVDRHGLVGNIVEHWKHHADGVRTVAFAVSVKHSVRIAEQFRAAGVPAEHLDGTTPNVERDAILARLESGETLVVSSVGVLSEGWDQPAVKCAILARPTQSTGLYLQQAGRILRPWNDQGAVILDHSGNAHMHGLPQDDRAFSLDSTPKKRRKDKTNDAPVKTCQECFAIVHAAVRACPECGGAFSSACELPEEDTGQLVEVPTRPHRARELTPDEKDMRLRHYRQMRMLADRKGFKPGYAKVLYKKRFRVWPPAELVDEVEAELATRDAVRQAAQTGLELSWD